MRLAAIDIGMNSIHTVIVEVGEDFGTTVLDTTKDAVQLGRGRDTSGNLPAHGMTHALASLRKSARLCERHSVARTLVVGTSAIREAPNGPAFLELIRRKIGVDASVLSEEEEGRLIYLAVRGSVHLDGKPFLAIDIGGGTVKLIWGTPTAYTASRSLKLGALRLSEEYPLSDTPTAEELKLLREFVDLELDRVTETHRFETVVATSGAMHQLARLAVGDASRRAGKSLHQQAVTANALRAVCRQVAASSLAERKALRALDRTRVRTIVPGAVVCEALLDRYDIEEIVVCEHALREGVLYDYVQRHSIGGPPVEDLPSVRERGVSSLGRRCGWNEEHARHVARLSVSLFDQLAQHHQWNPEERALLHYASLLHDVGMVVNVSGHHRHGQYLIEHGELLGFAPREIALMGNIVRYHRRSKPRRKHETYGALDGDERLIVDRLAGILRVAESLDRTYSQAVKGIECEMAPGHGKHRGPLVLTLAADSDVEVELSFASTRTDLLSKAVRRQVQVRVADAGLAAIAAHHGPTDPGRPNS